MISGIALTLLFVLANAFFVAAEFAIVKVRLSVIELRVRSGNSLAKIAKHIVTHLDAYLSATQLGITLTSLALGWIGESVVAQIVLDVMAAFGVILAPELAHKIALPIAFMTITILHIVFGELAPKSLAIQYPDKVTMAISLPLRIFFIVFKPFIWILNGLANLIIRMVGLQTANEGEQVHSSEEIRYLLEESSKSGEIDAIEHKMLENIFDFSDTPVKQIMVPRTRISAIEIGMELNDIIDKFIEEGYSRMPVYRGSIDVIIGEIYGKDLIKLQRHQDTISINDIIRPALFINEEEMISILLKTLQKEHAHIAVVLNEFGGTAGIVTLEDILEEIVGEIQDEYDEEKPMVEETSTNEYNISASITIDDVNELLPIPLPEDDDYETVGGFILSILGRIPENGENLVYERYNIEITKSSDRRIEEVKLTLLPEVKNEDEE